MSRQREESSHDVDSVFNINKKAKQLVDWDQRVDTLQSIEKLSKTSREVQNYSIPL